MVITLFGATVKTHKLLRENNIKCKYKYNNILKFSKRLLNSSK